MAQFGSVCDKPWGDDRWGVSSREGDGDSVAEAFRFINDTQSVSREHGGSFISVMSLHPQWPFERLDKQMTQMLRSMEFRGEEAPVIAFVGIRGNAGYAMEPIPVGKKGW